MCSDRIFCRQKKSSVIKLEATTEWLAYLEMSLTALSVQLRSNITVPAMDLTYNSQDYEMIIHADVAVTCGTATTSLSTLLNCTKSISLQFLA
jgi:hypothetical protein